jgi:hypothetical protein
LEPLVLIIPLIFFGIAILVATQIAAVQRRKTLAAWARWRGFEFAPFRDGGFGRRHSWFQCLNKGSSRYANNVARGQVGPHELCAFDYHYTTGSGKNKTHHHFSGVIITTNLPLKPLSIRNETVFDRLASVVGFEDIQFESVEFNKQFHVSSSDRRWAFDVLPQSTMEFLLDSPKFQVEFRPCLVLARRDRLFQPQDFDAAIEVIEGILRRLPASLVQELQGADR